MFHFGAVVRKYASTYHLVRTGDGDYNRAGDYVPGIPVSIPCLGSIQPVSARLLELEGGRYTADDRILYTTQAHQVGEVIEYQGNRYTIDEKAYREYTDIGKYVLKLVRADD